MKILYIYLSGIIILLGAILLNLLASYAGLATWYDFLKNPGKGSLFTYIWLFIIYPLGLGVLVYLAVKLFHL